MTNEQKIAQLEEMAFDAAYGDHDADAVLLRECAAMMREREAVERDAKGNATRNGLHRWAGPVLNGFVSLVAKDGLTLHLDWHPTLEAAQAAAVAWVDGQEGNQDMEDKANGKS